MTHRVNKILYKALLRRGSLFDKYPLLKTECGDSKTLLYVPSFSFKEEIRRSFKKDTKEPSQKTLTKGFEVYRNLGAMIDRASQKSPWYNQVEFNKNTLKQEYPVKHTTTLEPGALLIAHPRVDQPDLHRAVFLVLKHDKENTIAVQLNKTIDFPIKLTQPKQTSKSINLAGPGQFTSPKDVANTKDFEFEPPDSLHYDDEYLGGPSLDEEEIIKEIDVFPIPMNRDGTNPENMEPPVEGAHPIVVLDEEGNLTMWYFLTPTAKRKKSKSNFDKFKRLSDQTQFPKGSIQQSEFSKLVHYGGSSPGWIVIHNKEYVKDSYRFSVSTNLSFTTNNQSIQEILSTSSPTDYRVFKGFTSWRTEYLQNSLIKTGKLILAKSPYSLIFTNELNPKKINLSDPVLKENETEITEICDKKERLVTPLSGTWSHLLGLMGGEFFHFSHIDTPFKNSNENNSSFSTVIQKSKKE